ncbi:uncharacterized protein JCM6883_004637 [Sporobolomyces salmoneus]|uniref:uncharacterized protein n=1 Tax=Sporobolomyces salmoneus TaxID=183962 RepID=UPI00317A1D97
MQSYLSVLDDGEDQPGIPGDQWKKYANGPWFSTQLTLSLTIGLFSFLLFCILRRKEKFQVLYKPRTLLKGFSPHEVHDHESFFGWVLPTLKTSEFVVLQLVGLDAAVLLSFLRTGFLFFLTCTLVAFSVLVPINYRENGTLEGVPPSTNSTDGDTSPKFTSHIVHVSNFLRPVNHGSTLYLTSHLVFAYVFTILALIFLHRNWRRYIPLRQLFSLELAHSIPARTVMITSLPPHLRSERALADYFEGLKLTGDGEGGGTGLGVESVVVSRAIGSMKEFLERRTRALRTLEEAWTEYLGNPVKMEGKNAVFGYDRVVEVERILSEADQTTNGDEERGFSGNGNGGVSEGRLIDVDDADTPATNQLGGGGGGGDEAAEVESILSARAFAASAPPKIISTKKRPTLRPHWFAKKVDALDYYAEQFRKADEAVRKRRKGKFRPTGTAFVTFQSLASAQIAAQTVHYPSATEFKTELAPEPRDLNWGNLNLSNSSTFIRRILVVLVLLVLLSVWSIPVAALASLLSWNTVKETVPKLAEILDKSPRLRGLVQTTLPSLALVIFNNLLPFFLEALSIFQGLEARSWIELSQLKKYHISLVLTTLLVPISASTYQLLQDISQSPAKFLDKLTDTLPKTRNFAVAYVMLSGLGLMPLQLLELGTVIPRYFYQIFLTKTPRDYAELNAPSMVNLGVVYPQALLIWTLGLTYSIIMPVILPFTTIYFGLAYLVYKYRFLFVFYRPYESRGQAWPIAFNRVGLALLIFQIFMFGLFTVRKAFLLSVLMVPLSLATMYTMYWFSSIYLPLSKYINLSQAAEVTHGATAGDVVQLRQGHPVTISQTNLNRGRYSYSGDGIYAVAKTPYTDYSQPPLSDSYPGVVSTSSNKRYGHPALFGSLPEPWLPAQPSSEPLPSSAPQGELPQAVKDALVVIDLGRGWRKFKKGVKKGLANATGGTGLSEEEEQGGGKNGRGGGMRRNWSTASSEGSEADPSRAWRGSSEEPEIGGRRSGPQDLEDDEDEDEEEEQTSRYSTFYPHRRNTNSRFPPRGAAASDTEDEG